MGICRFEVFEVQYWGLDVAGWGFPLIGSTSLGNISGAGQPVTACRKSWWEEKLNADLVYVSTG